jgi:dienelactone hydrolase
MQSSTFNVTTPSGMIEARLMEPDAGALGDDPALLFTFALDRDTSLTQQPYSIAAEAFVAAGHRAVCFDQPNHGSRVDADGEGIAGYRNAVVRGHDPFTAFVEEVRAVADQCIADGIVRADRCVIAGTSRGGYMACRVLADDDRFAAGAAFAPVTDWAALSEFEADMDRDDVQRLRLTEYADQLGGKSLFIAIGTSDARVDTSACSSFCKAVADAETERGLPGEMDFQLCPDSVGHSILPKWHSVGARFLLRALETE